MDYERQLAKKDFSEARFKSFLNFVRNVFTQQPTDLVWFDDLKRKLRPASEHYIGMQTVPIDRIIGSEGRYKDFDNRFLPRHSQTEERWQNIDVAYYKDIPLPPVSLYKIGDIYCVRDGNHRVSVARTKGVEFVDADVIEITTLIRLTDIKELDKKILEYELAEFYRITGLDTLRPVNRIAIRIIGNFEILIKHIQVHHYFLGQQAKQDVPYADAAESWYDHVYLPLVELIEKKEVLDDLAKYGVSDAYIWIIEHWYFLKQQYGPYIGPDKAVKDFARHHRRNVFYWTFKKIFLILREIR